MIELKSTVSTIEQLLQEGSEASLTYAALECRLAIERICYDRLRVAHDYISHDDLKKWQPRDIVNILIAEVNPTAAQTFTLSISRDASDTPPHTAEDYNRMVFVPIGTQIGFDPQKLGRLWNALANVALHITIPTKKEETVGRYGDAKKVKEKVVQALEEIRRLSTGTLVSSGMGEEVTFQCVCGAKNKRRLGILNDRQIVSCILPNCKETYEFFKEDLSFGRRTLTLTCRNCLKNRHVPTKLIEKLPVDKNIHFDCEQCGDTIHVSWDRCNLRGQRLKEHKPHF
jgi:hypothetical protein